MEDCGAVCAVWGNTILIYDCIILRCCKQPVCLKDVVEAINNVKKKKKRQEEQEENSRCQQIR